MDANEQALKERANWLLAVIAWAQIRPVSGLIATNAKLRLEQLIKDGTAEARLPPSP